MNLLRSPLVFALGAVFLASGQARAQMKCGSTMQAVEQVTLEVLGPAFSAWGPYGDATAAALGVQYTESPADMFTRCWQEATEEEDEPQSGYNDIYGLLEPDDDDDDDDDGDAFTWGDPHVVTFDGLSYDFHGAGDFVLVEHQDSQTIVQTRYVRSGDERVSAQHALAIRVGGRVVTLYEAGPTQRVPVTVDGNPIPFLSGGWYDDDDLHMQRIGSWIFIRFSNGLAVATASGRTNRIHVPSAWAGQVRGLAGNDDGDPANDVARRDGSLVDPHDDSMLYGPFLDDWNVAPDDSLFASPFDVATLGPVRPVDAPTLAELPADDVAAARDHCISVGLTAGRGLEACIFDVAWMGDPSWATATTELQRPVMTADVLTPNVTQSIDLVDGVIEGSLEPAGSAHEIKVPAADGEDVTRILRVADHCDAVLPAAVAVVIDGRARAQRSLECGISLTLPSVEHSLLVMDPSGGTADYALRVIERASGSVVDAGAFIADQPIRIPVAENDQRWRWALDAETVQTLFFPQAELVASADSDASVCSARWSLRDAEDQELSSGSLCIDAPHVRSADAVALQINMPAGVGGIFRPGSVQSGNRVTVNLTDRVRQGGVLSTPGQIDVYALQVDAGTRLLLMNEAGGNDCGFAWSVLENGEEVFRGPSCFDTNPIAIESGGEVEIHVDAVARTGSYIVEIVRVPEDRISPLTPGEPYDASISTPGARVTFTFAGNADSEILLADMVGDNSNCRINWRVRGPGSGEVIFEGPVCFDTDPISLEETGEHVLEVTGDRSATGPVSVTVFDVSEPTVNALRFGEFLDGSITAPGGRAHFTFSASAGDELILRKPEQGNDDCGIVWRILHASSNDVVFQGPVCFDSQPITIEESGDYILEIDGQQARTGDVGVTVEKQ